MVVLGIESSCDETSASVVKDGNTMLSNVIASSMAEHIKYGGIVPEIAARSHIEVIIPVIKQALTEADCHWSDIDAIAVTYGAGLGGSLLIGVITARTLALIYNIPLIKINHVQAHVYANWLTKSKITGYKMRSKQPSFPLLALIVSGGHSQLVLFNDHLNYKVLGRTKDDAIGEAFDKVAKMLGLPYPGGPSLSKLAKKGNPNQYNFPKAKMANYDYSFSGLKTSVLRRSQKLIGETYNFPSVKLSSRLSLTEKADLAASFQKAANESITDKVKKAYEQYQPRDFVIAGGVAANQELRLKLKEILPMKLEYPDIKLCTDNGAMVASLGSVLISLDNGCVDPLELDIAPRLAM